MCGIFAVHGNPHSGTLVLAGLKRLEYRGYDSWGMAWKENNRLQSIKKVGKISSTEKVVFNATIAIGHTRWATHGKVTTTNSHPHFSQAKDVAVVHNGIIENHVALRKKLEFHGVVFASQTDTEVIPQLISFHLRELPLLEAIQKTANELEGNLAFCALTTQSDDLYCFRRAAPLVIGKSPTGLIVSSDQNAFPKEVEENFFLSDNELAVVNSNAVSFDCKTGKSTPITWHKTVHSEASDLAGFDHYMLKEIFEQPSVIQRISKMGIVVPEESWKDIESIIFIACGTSWHAGVVGSYLFEQLARIPCRTEYASEFRYRDPLVSEKTLVIAISQSGETADTLAAVEMVRQKGARVLGICNNPNSSIARGSDFVINLSAGPEIGVASTKAFTAQVAVLIKLCATAAKAKGFSKNQNIETELESIPEKMNQILAKRDEITAIAHGLSKYHNAIFLGRDKSYPIALEGALKLKEVSYIHAEGLPAAEMKHGPIALIDRKMPVVAICVDDQLFPKVLSNLQEVKARKGQLIVVTDSDSQELLKLADTLIQIPKTMPELSMLLTVIPLQLIAYEAAVFKKRDVDKPRNLAKSVTVE